MRRITLHPAAEEELRESKHFYEKHGGSSLASDFLKRVEVTLKIVRSCPQRFPHLPKCPKVQKCRLSRFPFAVYYIADKDNIWVIAVAHAKRRPEYWLNRLG